MFYLGCHRSELSLFSYRYSCKWLRAVSLLVHLFSIIVITLHEAWLTWKTYVVNVHFCSCFQEKATEFDFWMPIEKGHQLFVLYLKAEMLNVALCPFCGRVDRRLCLPFHDRGQQGIWGVVIAMLWLLFRSSQPKIITARPTVRLHITAWHVPFINDVSLVFTLTDWLIVIVCLIPRLTKNVSTEIRYLSWYCFH